MATRHSDRVRLGRRSKEKLLHQRQVLADYHEVWGQEVTGCCGYRSHTVDSHLSSSSHGPIVSRQGTTRSQPMPEAADDPTSYPPTRKTGYRGLLPALRLPGNSCLGSNKHLSTNAPHRVFRKKKNRTSFKERRQPAQTRYSERNIGRYKRTYGPRLLRLPPKCLAKSDFAHAQSGSYHSGGMMVGVYSEI